MNIAEVICREANRLPENLAYEVLDFIQYLQFKHALKDSAGESLKTAQQSVMNRIWDNPEDEVWNEL